MINLIDNQFLNSDSNRAISPSHFERNSLDNRMCEAFAGLSFPPPSSSMGGEIEFTSIQDEIETEDEDLVKVFGKLPEDLKKECSLKEPNAKSVRAWLSTVPQARLEQFKELDLSHANLSLIPTEISRFTGLKRLDFSHNSITDITPVLDVPTLTCLSFSHNQVSEIPSLTALTKLQYLSFHSNRMKPADGMLDLFPPKVRSSVALNLAAQDKKAPIPNSWRTARFDALPKDLFGVVAKYCFCPDALLVSKAWNEGTYLGLLQRYKSSSLLNRLIDSSTFKFEFIDSARLQNAKTAVFQVQKKVAELLKSNSLGMPVTLDPQSLEQAMHDRSLVLLSRKMYLPLPIDQAAANQPSVIRNWLSLSGLELSVIPKEIRFFTGLQSLFLSDNFIEDITPLSSLTNLTTLYLDRNQIQEVESLQPLVKLDILTIGGNKIKKIESLKSLNLSILDISGNPIEDMRGIGCMRGLTRLSAIGNKISDLSFIDKLVSLKELKVRFNDIEDVRPLTPLKNLTNLDIAFNRIRDIQPLSSLSELKTLQIENNYIRTSDIRLLEFPEAVRDQIKNAHQFKK